MKTPLWLLLLCADPDGDGTGRLRYPSYTLCHLQLPLPGSYEYRASLHLVPSLTPAFMSLWLSLTPWEALHNSTFGRTARTPIPQGFLPFPPQVLAHTFCSSLRLWSCRDFYFSPACLRGEGPRSFVVGKARGEGRCVGGRGGQVGGEGLQEPAPGVKARL